MSGFYLVTRLQSVGSIRWSCLRGRNPSVFMDWVGECLHKEHSPVGRCQGFVTCQIMGSDRWTRFLTRKAVLTRTLPCWRQLLLMFLSSLLDTQQPNLPTAEGARLMWAWMSSSSVRHVRVNILVYLSWMINHVFGVLITRSSSAYCSSWKFLTEPVGIWC